MRFVFRDRNQSVIDNLRAAFSGLHEFLAFEVGDLFTEGHQSLIPNWVVSPANSFGFMDGGVDDAIRQHFPDLEDRVKAAIRNTYDGEIPVGQAALVSAGRQTGRQTSITHCIVAPTMRSPQRIQGTVNVYLAFRAVVLFAKRDEALLSKEHTILCSGMGTATGGVQPGVAALQMRAAYRHAMEPPQYKSAGAARAADDGLKYGIGDYY